jgi:hypothetical protein
MLRPRREDSELFQRVVCQIGGRRINAVSTKLHRPINEIDHSDPLKNNTLRLREKGDENAEPAQDMEMTRYRAFLAVVGRSFV